MKVRELIEKLKECDQDAMVVGRGYEGGVTETDTVHEVEVYLNVNTAWYYGEHECVGHSYKDDEYEGKFDKVKAVLL